MTKVPTGKKKESKTPCCLPPRAHTHTQHTHTDTHTEVPTRYPRRKKKLSSSPCTQAADLSILTPISISISLPPSQHQTTSTHPLSQPTKEKEHTKQRHYTKRTKPS